MNLTMTKKKWGVGVILLIVILIVSLFLFGKGCSGCAQFGQDGAMQHTIDSLDQQNSNLRARLDTCLNQNLNQDKPDKGVAGAGSFHYYYSSPTPPAPKETKSYTETPVYKEDPAPPVKKDQTPTVKHGLGPMFFEGTDGKIYFCLNFSGNPAWFLPHLALVNGEQIFAQKNNQGGYNWVVSEDQLSDGFSGEWGVTRDGTFFVSCALVDRNNPGSDQLFILTTVTGWAPRPMQRSGSYYIFKP